MTDERRILLLTPPRNHAGFPSTTLPGGTPTEVAEEYEELQQEGLVSLARMSTAGVTDESPNFVVGTTEKGRGFLRSRGAAYLPETTLSQLGELLKASPKLPCDSQTLYRDRARFLMEEVATYLQEQNGDGLLGDNLKQSLERIRPQVERMLSDNVGAGPDLEDDRERAIGAVAAFRNALITRKASPSS